MSDQQFDIIFRGDIVFGHQLTDVKARLQQLFKADAAKVDALFSGRPVPLKRGLDHASALKYKEALVKAGAQVDVVAMSDAKPAPPTKSEAPALNLAQRLEQQAEVEKAEIAQREQAAREAALAMPSDAKSTWSLAPVGAYLLQASEKKADEPRAIDTSAISLRPEGGNILDASELVSTQPAHILIPDFEVAAVGADLISAEEKMELPLLELELEDWTLADLGEDLIAASEKITKALPSISALDVGLAPVGADLGQLKPDIQIVIPDTSGIRLAD